VQRARLKDDNVESSSLGRAEAVYFEAKRPCDNLAKAMVWLDFEAAVKNYVSSFLAVMHSDLARLHVLLTSVYDSRTPLRNENMDSEVYVSFTWVSMRIL